MVKIVIDENTLKQLGPLEQPAALCDATGRVLAYLTPVSSREDYAAVRSPHSDDELHRRAEETEMYTTSQIIERLEQL